MPGWASLPLAFVGVSLLTAVIGMYWDISLHIDNGRDPGPLANPAHYLILFGLFGIFVAGLLAMALPKDGKPSTTAVRLQNDWYAPLGGVLMTACAAFALAGFPLDDVWHRLFGQDVTLWGPTHLMLIGGASLATLAAAILTAEGLRAASASGREPTGHFATFRKAMLAGAFLVGLSTVQAEFDFSVPQFRLLYHPVLLMLAASVALVAARIWIGRGGALLTLGGYLIVRGLLTVLVGGLWGQTTPHFPLYAVEAIVRRGRGAVRLHPPPDRVRRGRGRRDRHRRPGGRVGLVARVDDDVLAGLAAPRGRDLRLPGRRLRRRDRRRDRPRAGPARRSTWPRPRAGPSIAAGRRAARRRSRSRCRSPRATR